MSVERRVKKTGPSKGKTFYLVRIYQGKDKPYLEKVFDKKLDAENYENQYKNYRKNTPDKTISEDTLFGIVLDRYIEKLTQSKKDQTTSNYKSRIKKWIRPYYGNFPAGNINLDNIEEFVEEIEGNGASDSMINYCLIVLNQALKFASTGQQKYILHNPMDDWEWAEAETGVKKIKYWSKPEVKDFIKFAQGDHFYLLNIIMMNTGIRKAEAMALEPSDFNFELRSLSVTKQISTYSPKKNEPVIPKALVVTSLKNKMNREVPLNNAAFAAAKLYVQANKGRHFLASSPTGQMSKVIIKRGSKPTVIEIDLPSAKTLNDHLKVITAKAEIKYIGVHGLRHTFAANFMMNGGDLYDLSTLLGHKSINSTQIYAHLSQKHLLKAANIVNFEG